MTKSRQCLLLTAVASLVALGLFGCVDSTSWGPFGVQLTNRTSPPPKELNKPEVPPPGPEPEVPKPEPGEPVKPVGPEPENPVEPKEPEKPVVTPGSGNNNGNGSSTTTPKGTPRGVVLLICRTGDWRSAANRGDAPFTSFLYRSASGDKDLSSLQPPYARWIEVKKSSSRDENGAGIEVRDEGSTEEPNQTVIPYGVHCVLLDMNKLATSTDNAIRLYAETASSASALTLLSTEVKHLSFYYSTYTDANQSLESPSWSSRIYRNLQEVMESDLKPKPGEEESIVCGTTICIYKITGQNSQEIVSATIVGPPAFILPQN